MHGIPKPYIISLLVMLNKSLPCNISRSTYCNLKLKYRIPLMSDQQLTERVL